MTDSARLRAVPDPIDAAIAAAAEPAPIEMQQVNVVITSTGRPAAVVIPIDITDAELGELAGWMLTAVMNAKRAERAAAAAGPQLEIARSIPPARA